MLPLDCPEVKTYLADPTHRKKAACSHLFKHAKAPKRSVNTQGLTKYDCEMIQYNLGSYIKQYRHLPLEDFVADSDCVYLHHFNDHSKCGTWCKYSLKLPVEKRTIQTEELARKYRCKIRNKDMFEVVKQKLSPYLTSDSLTDINHKFDTQINEAINEMITSYAPKNRVFCGTSSLSGRINMAICVHSLTLLEFLERFCEWVGLATGESVSYYLENNNIIIKRRHKYKRKLTTKKKRSVGKRVKHCQMLILEQCDEQERN